MPRTTQPYTLFYTLLAAALATACGSYSSDITPVMDSGIVEFSTRGPGLRTINSVDAGIFIPDGSGGYLLSPGAPRQSMDPSLLEAQELRLKVKELAAQLLETRPNDLLSGLVALPTSFVNLNDFNDTSALGRYMAEAMFHEFNQRGFPVREYRLDGKIHMKEAQGEFALSRDLPPLTVNQNWSAVLVGTYLKNSNAYFVNVRLIRPADGLVLRTGQLVFGNNKLLADLTAKPPPPVLPPLSTGSLRINLPSAQRK